MSPNHILARLSRADFGLLEPNLEAVELPVRKLLHPRNKRIKHVYFPESGIASVIAHGEHALEIGLVGRDGMMGVAIVLASDERPQHDTYIQVAGKGQRVAAEHLRQASEASASLRQVLLQYVYTFMTQIAHTAIANGRHNIEERLARWLLLADDRLDDHVIPLIHEFLAVMLGIQRPSVTIALRELEHRGFISHRRAAITIIDRKGLIGRSNGAYVG